MSFLPLWRKTGAGGSDIASTLITPALAGLLRRGGNKMNKVICIFCILLLAISCCPISAAASFIEAPQDCANKTEPRYCSNFNIVNEAADLNKEGKDLIVNGKITVTKDVSIANEHIYLKNGSSLIIKNGATLSIGGDLTVERGAKLYITNGKLVCGKSSVLQNFGRIIVRKDGLLSITNIYDSNGGASVNLQGDMLLGNISLSKLSKKIKKYDNNFNLNDYCIVYVNAVPTFYYCVDDVVTDYYYKYVDNRLKRKGCSLKKVYNEKTYNNIKNAAGKYLSEKKISNRFEDDALFFGIDIRFDYSFALKKLSYHESYAEFIPMEDGFYWNEGGYDEELKC